MIILLVLGYIALKAFMVYSYSVFYNREGITQLEVALASSLLTAGWIFSTLIFWRLMW